ncbi:MAG: exo-alpha-sialidase, partial [Planctomycetes bacterium]|nr:exo-alpha-sialidase [Planctomycetota bacterium]
TLLLPMARWTDRDEKRELVHSVFASRDAGDSFPTSHATFSDCHEAHVIQLRSGRLLGAFRYQRPPHPGETPDEIRALGGNPDWAHPTTGKRPKSAFKHVWIGESDDLGRTWKCFGAVRDRHGRPLLDFGEAHGQLVEAPDGRVVLVHDCRYPYERAHIRARLSHDEGRTWDPEIYYLSEGIGYPSSVALADGTLVTVTGNTMLDKSFQPIGQWRAQAIRWKLPPAEVKVREALEEEP